ncbi:MAG: ABC transporter permease subunit, partial [Bdellovibrionales bacterium]|nr:ABC transporter permease subunit [Bdellovibrionales bacterium]
ALRFTCFQAGASALFAVAGGFIGALGLLAFSRRRWRSLLEFFILLPAFLPALFVILPYMNILSFFKWSPFGLSGIVAIQVIMTMGLVTLIVARILESKVGTMVELAWLEGASRWIILRSAVIPLLRMDLASLYFYLFTLFFASFSVPLILGGPESLTLEILIYEKVRLSENWAEAFSLGIFQIAILFFLSLGVRETWGERSEQSSNLICISLPCFLIFPLAATLLVVMGHLEGLSHSLSIFLNSPVLLSQLPSLIGGTLYVSGGVGLLILFLLLLVAGLSPHWGLDRFLMGYTAPSTVLTGFAFLLLGVGGWWQVHFVLILGLSILMLPALYRMMGRSILFSLRQQLIVARIAGASWALIFTRIVVPQVWRDFCWLAGIGAFWASGDFALSTLLAEGNTTIALTAKAYMSSYHLEVATILNLILLLIGALCLLSFGGLSRVFGEKPRS